MNARKKAKREKNHKIGGKQKIQNKMAEESSNVVVLAIKYIFLLKEGFSHQIFKNQFISKATQSHTHTY